MTTAIDSNILIDLLGPSTGFTAGAIEALDAARLAGALLICPVVAAEISGHFATAEDLGEALREMQIGVGDFMLEDLHQAGSAFLRYRRKSSRPKDRMLADFLVGAHALNRAHALLTRDRGYYRTYFPKLKLVVPESKTGWQVPTPCRVRNEKSLPADQSDSPSAGCCWSLTTSRSGSGR